MPEQTTPEDESAVRIGICLPPAIKQAAMVRLNELGYRKFSRYAQALIRADCGLAPNPGLKKAPRKRGNAVRHQADASA